ncbi:MAG: DNA polymerase I [Lachnospirales bacterium]
MKEKLLLIDGHGMIYRAFYALPVLTNQKGVYTNAIYGFLNIILKVMDEEKPTSIGVAFDVSSKTFRTEKFADYKGTRKSMPDELRPQVPLLQELLNKMNIPIFQMEGYEADDILGTISLLAEKQDIDVCILTGDRDLLQLATENVKIKILKTKGGKTEGIDYYSRNVLEEYEVTPKEFIDVKGLTGDISDNIPGVPGIGEKTAVKIIKEYKSIENAIKNLDNIKPKRAKENLDEFREQALLSRELATIILDVPVEIDFEKLVAGNIFTNEALEMVKELQLKTLYDRFSVNKVEESATLDYEIVDNPFVLDELVNNLLKEKEICFKAKYMGNFQYISFIINNKVFIILEDSSLTESDIFQSLKCVFESDIPKVTHDSKALYVKYFKENIEFKNIILDIELASYILSPAKSTYDYEVIALEFLNKVYPSLEDIIGKGKNKVSFKLLALDKKAIYISNEIKCFNEAKDIIKKKIIENNQEELLYNIEQPLAKVLASMECLGIGVSKSELISYGEELDGQINILSDNIIDLAGESFNINSTKQMGTILFEKLELPAGKKTKTGYSTAVDVLEKLVDKHPIINFILEYRTLTKLKSTYIDGLIPEIEEDGRIHSKFSQTTAVTGRISSNEPNLQNIPVKIEVGRKLRKAFIPKDGHVFISADYSQIELRVLAHISKDEEMISAFLENKDIHRLTASEVYKTPFDKVDLYQRGNAKAVNFGIVYGMGSYSLSQDLKITRKEAERYIQGYFNKYPNVKVYLDNAVNQAKENGFATTIFNRMRRIPEISSSNFNTRSFGERIAMNMPIQGAAADIIKIAMLKTYNRLKSECLKSKLILQVHDELMLEVPNSEVEIVSKILREEMENTYELSVPLIVSLSVGENWYELK